MLFSPPSLSSTTFIKRQPRSTNSARIPPKTDTEEAEETMGGFGRHQQSFAFKYKELMDVAIVPNWSVRKKKTTKIPHCHFWDSL